MGGIFPNIPNMNPSGMMGNMQLQNQNRQQIEYIPVVIPVNETMILAQGQEEEQNKTDKNSVYKKVYQIIIPKQLYQVNAPVVIPKQHNIVTPIIIPPLIQHVNQMVVGPILATLPASSQFNDIHTPINTVPLIIHANESNSYQQQISASAQTFMPQMQNQFAQSPEFIPSLKQVQTEQKQLQNAIPLHQSQQQTRQFQDINQVQQQPIFSLTPQTPHSALIIPPPVLQQQLNIPLLSDPVNEIKQITTYTQYEQDKQQQLIQNNSPQKSLNVHVAEFHPKSLQIELPKVINEFKPGKFQFLQHDSKNLVKSVALQQNQDIEPSPLKEELPITENNKENAKPDQVIEAQKQISNFPQIKLGGVQSLPLPPVPSNTIPPSIFPQQFVYPTINQPSSNKDLFVFNPQSQSQSNHQQPSTIPLAFPNKYNYNNSNSKSQTSSLTKDKNPNKFVYSPPSQSANIQKLDFNEQKQRNQSFNNVLSLSSTQPLPYPDKIDQLTIQKSKQTTQIYSNIQQLQQQQQIQQQNKITNPFPNQSNNFKEIEDNNFQIKDQSQQINSYQQKSFSSLQSQSSPSSQVKMNWNSDTSYLRTWKELDNKHEGQQEQNQIDDNNLNIRSDIINSQGMRENYLKGSEGNTKTNTDKENKQDDQMIQFANVLRTQLQDQILKFNNQQTSSDPKQQINQSLQQQISPSSLQSQSLHDLYRIFSELESSQKINAITRPNTQDIQTQNNRENNLQQLPLPNQLTGLIQTSSNNNEGTRDLSQVIIKQQLTEQQPQNTLNKSLSNQFLHNQLLANPPSPNYPRHSVKGANQQENSIQKPNSSQNITSYSAQALNSKQSHQQLNSHHLSELPPKPTKLLSSKSTQLLPDKPFRTSLPIPPLPPKADQKNKSMNQKINKNINQKMNLDINQKINLDMNQKMNLDISQNQKMNSNSQSPSNSLVSPNYSASDSLGISSFTSTLQITNTTNSAQDFSNVPSNLTQDIQQSQFHNQSLSPVQSLTPTQFTLPISFSTSDFPPQSYSPITSFLPQQLTSSSLSSQTSNSSDFLNDDFDSQLLQYHLYGDELSFDDQSSVIKNNIFESN